MKYAVTKLELDSGGQIKDGPSAETEFTNLEQGKKLVSGQPQTKAGGRRASGIYVTNAKVGGKNSNDPARSDFSLDHFRSICLEHRLFNLPIYDEVHVVRYRVDFHQQFPTAKAYLAQETLDAVLEMWRAAREEHAGIKTFTRNISRHF